MKLLNLILSIIAAFLLVIAFRLVYLGILIERSGEYSALLIKAEQSVINSNQNLELEISSLRKQIADLSVNFTKK
jgi:hypothetical protein